MEFWASFGGHPISVKRRLQTGIKMQTEGKMQTADYRPEEKCRPRRSKEVLPKIAKIVAMIAMIRHTRLSNECQH